MVVNNETIHLPVGVEDYEAVHEWMKEITSSSSGWYIAGPHHPWELGQISIVFCSDFPFDREPFKVLIKLKWR
jgi:hypothetical protein